MFHFIDNLKKSLTWCYEQNEHWIFLNDVYYSFTLEIKESKMLCKTDIELIESIFYFWFLFIFLTLHPFFSSISFFMFNISFIPFFFICSFFLFFSTFIVYFYFCLPFCSSFCLLFVLFNLPSFLSILYFHFQILSYSFIHWILSFAFTLCSLTKDTFDEIIFASCDIIQEYINVGPIFFYSFELFRADHAGILPFWDKSTYSTWFDLALYV